MLTAAPRPTQRGNESRLTTVLEGDESEEEEEEGEREAAQAAQAGRGPASPGNGGWGPAGAHPGEGDSDSDDGPLMADDASPPARRAPPPPPRHRRTLVEFSASRKEVWKGYLSVPKVLKSKVSWYSLQENGLLRRWQGAPGSISFQPLSELAVTPGRFAETSSTKATAGRKVFFEVLDPATGQWTLHKFQAKTEKAAALLREQLADVFARAREAASEPGPSLKPKPKPKPKPAPPPRPATEWEENPMKGLAAALGGGSPAEEPPSQGSQGSPKDLIDFSFPDPPAPAGDPFPPAPAATPATTPEPPAPGSPSGQVDSAQLEDAVQTVAQTLQYLLDIETLRKNNATGSPVNAQLAAVGEAARAIRDRREEADLPEDVTYFISTLQPTVPPISAREEVYNLTAHSLFDRVAMMEQDLRCLNEYFLPLRNARAERGEAGAEAAVQKLEVRVAKLEESFDAYRAQQSATLLNLNATLNEIKDLLASQVKANGGDGGVGGVGGGGEGNPFADAVSPGPVFAESPSLGGGHNPFA